MPGARHHGRWKRAVESALPAPSTSTSTHVSSPTPGFWDPKGSTQVGTWDISGPRAPRPLDSLWGLVRMTAGGGLHMVHPGGLSPETERQRLPPLPHAGPALNKHPRGQIRWHPKEPRRLRPTWVPFALGGCLHTARLHLPGLPFPPPGGPASYHVDKNVIFGPQATAPGQLAKQLLPKLPLQQKGATQEGELCLLQVPREVTPLSPPRPGQTPRGTAFCSRAARVGPEGSCSHGGSLPSPSPLVSRLNVQGVPRGASRPLAIQAPFPPREPLSGAGDERPREGRGPSTHQPPTAKAPGLTTPSARP